MLVGTTQGSGRFATANVGLLVLPRPGEVAQMDEAFEERYAQLEGFLTAEAFQYAAIWPIPGLVCAELPLQLESSLELDSMSDRELAMALNAGFVRTPSQQCTL